MTTKELQQEAIMMAIHELGYDPQALPPDAKEKVWKWLVANGFAEEGGAA